MVSSAGLLIALPWCGPWALQRSRADQAPAPQPTAADSLPALLGLRVGMRYRDARHRLLQSGWIPQHNPSPEQCNSVRLDPRCLRYPEFAACSNTGMGFCKALWNDARGQQLAVITAGEPSPGEVGTVVRWFAE